MTINDIFRVYGDEYRLKHPSLSEYKKKIMENIANCRTAVLGGRKEVCDNCNYSYISYFSCRDRHCPQCQFMKKEQWIKDRKNEILPFQYFHAVFTIPHELNPLVLLNKALLYKLLFTKVKETLLSVSEEEKYLGAKIGFFCILHTWGQRLDLHPHLHCVIPGGGFSEKKNSWLACKKDYLLPIAVLKQRFRSVFLKGLKELYKTGSLYLKGSPYENADCFYGLIDKLFKRDWVMYLKETFESSSSVIEYLARYTHRIAISSYRIIKVEDRKVFFKWKDYNDANKIKVMSLEVMEFIRRFLLHVVPHRFVRIRYYGFLSHRNKKKEIALAYEYFKIANNFKPQETQSWENIFQDVTGIDLSICPRCGEGKMIVTEILPLQRRAPPERVA